MKKQKEAEVALEDGDNSSSGVSSDQEITSGVNTEYNERIMPEQNSMTLPSPKGSRQQIGKLNLILYNKYFYALVSNIRKVLSKLGLN